MFDTIAAIASGNLVNQAISIIRVSGPDSFCILKKIFKGTIGTNKTITYGKIYDGETLIDEVLVNWFEAPNTFTGENIVEINAHGGIVNTNMILKLLLSHGCRLAEPGEFSRRSFLNGKMDLVKAEAINDLIHAKTQKQALTSATKFSNATSDLIDQMLQEILLLIGHCETNIDYPEIDDIEELTSQTLLPKILQLLNRLENIIIQSEKAQLIFQGINVAIVGQPNVGKSSLLNALLKEEKAIVTDLAGTTRDIVEGQWQMQGILFNIKDTAGIRKSDNVVENIGIKKSLAAIDHADIVIHLIDTTNYFSDFDELIAQKSHNKIYLQVINKKDLLTNKVFDPQKIYISAKNNDLVQLEESIFQHLPNLTDLNDYEIVNNTRQLALIKKTKIALENAIQGLELGFGPDVVIVDLHNAWANLATIVGKADTDNLLDSMFTNFCLGK
ncbi:tRNA uridine-5-carboxymethylaminomethyl(34) synthesis GTPase MnmE [Candidatus Mycoplasma pogonae]